ncbi:TPA_asm: VP [Abeoforma parvovirus]|nr:TPA_asm: VP [Abeoforma parvovirus]
MALDDGTKTDPKTKGQNVGQGSGMEGTKRATKQIPKRTLAGKYSYKMFVSDDFPLIEEPTLYPTQTAFPDTTKIYTLGQSVLPDGTVTTDKPLMSVQLPCRFIPNNNLWNYITPGDFNYYAHQATGYKVNFLRIRIHNTFPLYDYTATPNLELQGQGSVALKILEPPGYIQNQRVDRPTLVPDIQLNPNARMDLLYGDTDAATRFAEVNL